MGSFSVRASIVGSTAAFAFAVANVQPSMASPSFVVHLRIAGLARSPYPGTAQVKCSFSPDARPTLTKSATVPVGAGALDVVPLRLTWDYAATFKQPRRITCSLVSVMTNPPIPASCFEHIYSSLDVPAAPSSVSKSRTDFETRLFVVTIKWRCLENKP